jgi:hypothetical protein
MVVCCHQHPPKYNRQSLPPGQKEDSILPWNHHACSSPLGVTIERHTNKKKERKVPKERKKILLYIINNHQQ